MKILWLYGLMPGYDHNHWYHMGFAKILKQQNSQNLLAYGFGLKNLYPDLAPIDFDSNITASDLKKEFDFDVVIMDNRYRFFRRLNKLQYSKFFNNLTNVPKIMIEGDFHLHRREYLAQNWLKNNEIDLILHRHLKNLILGKKLFPEINHLWFPCSVDTDIFKPNLSIKRIPLIFTINYGFATKIYPYRNLVTKILEPEHLIKKSNGVLESTNYIECLQSYISHISDSSVCHVDVAKMFEIMASGSVLLADKGDDYGLKKLFPINSYCSYKRDGSDIIEMAKLIINNKDYVQVLTKNGVDCINKKHSHIIRANELINIIKDIL